MTSEITTNTNGMLGISAAVNELLALPSPVALDALPKVLLKPFIPCACEFAPKALLELLSPLALALSPFAVLMLDPPLALAMLTGPELTNQLPLAKKETQETFRQGSSAAHSTIAARW